MTNLKNFYIATAITFWLIFTGFSCYVGYRVSYDKVIKDVNNIVEREAYLAYRKGYVECLRNNEPVLQGRGR